MVASGSRPTKQCRRSKADIETIKDAIREALRVDQPMTVRQVYYRLVSTGVIDKTEGEYKSTVVRLLGDMRRDGDVPFDWIADSTRWQRKPDSHGSMESALRDAAEFYRRDLWSSQPVYVEIWMEKDALAGIIYEVTSKWDVPLMVTRGYSSLSFLHSSAETIVATGKPAHLYYFGDHDPSGCDITRAVESGIREFAPRVDLTFERVAVTRAQIESMRLPTRPTKTTDSRSKNFEGGSVEVDAIPPAQLREIADRCITSNIDPESYRKIKLVEAEERRTMMALADWYDQKKASQG